LLIDTASVVLGATPTAWVMINYASPQRGAHSALYQWQANCAEESVRVRSAVRFDAQGAPLWANDRGEDAYTRAEPGTFFARVVAFICTSDRPAA
jgi:hypothetical protein